MTRPRAATAAGGPRSTLPRLLPAMRWVTCPTCGGRQSIPTWNDPEPEPPVTALVCTVRSCNRAFQAPI